MEALEEKCAEEDRAEEGSRPFRKDPFSIVGSKSVRGYGDHFELS